MSRWLGQLPKAGPRSARSSSILLAIVYLTLSASSRITSSSSHWSGANPSVGTGSQNSMIHFDGSGIAPTGPNQGNNGVIGKYGSFSSAASSSQSATIG